MIDSVLISVSAGKGGDGVVTFRREKYIPRGGPDGGDGGNGGDVFLTVDPRKTTLSDFARQRRFAAEDGKPGMRTRKHGRSGEDLIVGLPVGTIVRQEIDGFWLTIADFTEPDEKIVIARGGRGGLGNSNFATSTHQTPHEATPGRLGESKEIQLDLKLLADVGLIGLPNAGKSTFLKMVTKASPKIGNYPFTTLEPNLGTVTHKNLSFVLADIPGLIEGASKGKGLGDQFLRHVERTKVLVHLVPADSVEPEKDYQTIRNELKIYNPKLLEKPEIIVISKSDLSDVENSQDIEKFAKKYKALKVTQNDPKSYHKVLDKLISAL